MRAAILFPALALIIALLGLGFFLWRDEAGADLGSEQEVGSSEQRPLGQSLVRRSPAETSEKATAAESRREIRVVSQDGSEPVQGIRMLVDDGHGRYCVFLGSASVVPIPEDLDVDRSVHLQFTAPGFRCRLVSATLRSLMASGVALEASGTLQVVVRDEHNRLQEGVVLSLKYWGTEALRDLILARKVLALEEFQGQMKVLRQEDMDWPKTGVNGELTMDCVPRGPAKIVLEKDGERLLLQEVGIPAGPSRLELRIPESRSKSLVLTNSHGNPVVAAQVILMTVERFNRVIHARETTDENGIARFKDLRLASDLKGLYWFEKDGYWGSAETVMGEPSTSAVLEDEGEHPELICLAPDGSRLRPLEVRCRESCSPALLNYSEFSYDEEKDFLRLPFSFPGATFSVSATLPPATYRGIRNRCSAQFKGGQARYELQFVSPPSGFAMGQLILDFDETMIGEAVSVSLNGNLTAFTRVQSISGPSMDLGAVYEGRKCLLVRHPERGVFARYLDLKPDEVERVKVDLRVGRRVQFQPQKIGADEEGRFWLLMVMVNASDAIVVAGRGFSRPGEIVTVENVPEGELYLSHWKPSPSGKLRTFVSRSLAGAVQAEDWSVTGCDLTVTFDESITEPCLEFQLSSDDTELSDKRPAKERFAVFSDLPPGLYTVVARGAGKKFLGSTHVSIARNSPGPMATVSAPGH